MPTYKLFYFDLPGRAEGIRLAFHYAKVPFEDVRIKREEWPGKKSSFKYQQIPVLKVDDHEIAQTNAILRYIGRKFGIEGKDEFETARLDELNELLNEVQMALATYPGVALGFIPGDREQLKQEKLIPAAEKYAPLETGSGYFVKSGPTYLDFHISEVVQNLARLDPDVWSKYKVLDEHHKRIHALPQLKSYLDAHPH
ncbi:Glutathione S-transferase-1 [Aphelenchoides bicaudatus]|nr:Glutathione S-transferase-1 [Aphelenchoides bicaudatus]